MSQDSFTQQIGLSLSLQGVGAVRDRRRILRDFSLEIGSNEFIGILGPSGSGKSTLLEMLTLTGRPSEGRIVFDDRYDIEYEKSRYAEAFGYVPQLDVLYPNLTVAENLWYAARLRLKDKDESGLRAAIDEMLCRVGLENQRDQLVSRLSGGQRKRVGIAMELFKNPRLLILDEPTSGLDPAMERKLMEQLRKIADAGTTVICSTHVMENIALFDKVAVIGKKRIGSQEPESGDLDLFESPDKLLGHYSAKNYAELFSLLEADPNTIYLDDEPQRSKNVPPWAGRFLESRNVSSKPTFRQISDVFSRHWILFFRDRSLAGSTALLPLILGVMVVLSQQRESNLRPMLFFSIVIAIWFGMNNSVRSVVSERRNFSREALSGLSMHSFLIGKAAFYLALGIVQVLLLWLTVEMLGLRLCELLRDDLARVHGLFPFVLFGSYFSGLGLGLLVSTLSRTENSAIAMVPLLIMPQLLLSTVAAGNSLESLSDRQRIQPIAYALAETDAADAPDPVLLTVFKSLSAFCFSRPTFFLLELVVAKEPKGNVYLKEFVHFSILNVSTWLALWGAFWYRQQHWRTTRDT